jgi:hypothetical protein
VARKLKLSTEKITKHGALPDLVLVGIATLEDTTVGVATDTVNYTSSPQMSSTDRCLKCFIERITKVRQLLLLDLPGDDTAHDGRTPPAWLPKRSKRIATLSISHIPTSKQGKHLVLKRLRLTSGMSSPSTSALKTYEEIYSGDPGIMQAL